MAKANFQTDVDIKRSTWESLTRRVPSLTAYEKGLILDYKYALKNNMTFVFYTGIEITKKGENAN